MREIWLPMCHRPAIWQIGHIQTARGHTPPAFPATALRCGRSKASHGACFDHLSEVGLASPPPPAVAVLLCAPILFLSIHIVSYLYFCMITYFMQYLFFKQGLDSHERIFWTLAVCAKRRIGICSICQDPVAACPEHAHIVCSTRAVWSPAWAQGLLRPQGARLCACARLWSAGPGAVVSLLSSQLDFHYEIMPLDFHRPRLRPPARRPPHPLALSKSNMRRRIVFNSSPGKNLLSISG